MVLDRTAHAGKRHQTRAILPIWESLVFDYGTRVRSHGADLVFLDKAARKRISREIGGERGMRLFDRYWNQYLLLPMTAASSRPASATVGSSGPNSTTKD